MPLRLRPLFASVCVLLKVRHPLFVFFFFFNDTATTEIYTLSLHDALPISHRFDIAIEADLIEEVARLAGYEAIPEVDADRKSTRLNSSHDQISYAVFCLKKKKKKQAGALHRRY